VGNWPRWRRVLMYVAVVLAALLLLVGIPGWIATQPGFMGRYSNTAHAHETWAGSTHKSEDCQDCHVAPGVVPQAGFFLRMAGEFYLSLIPVQRTADFLGTPTNASCQACHSSLVAVSPKGDLNIPHKAHVQVLKIDCVVCHKYLVHDKSPEGRHSPAMATCLKCHDGQRAKSSCSACHRDKALPPSHQAADWLLIHPEKAKTTDCAKCHKWTAANWCVKCHETKPRTHTADWRKTHAERVKTHRNCEVCHTKAFCLRCHGTFPTLNYDPKLKPVQ